MLKLETLLDHKGHIISGEVLCNLLLNKILTFWIVKYVNCPTSSHNFQVFSLWKTLQTSLFFFQPLFLNFISHDGYGLRWLCWLWCIVIASCIDWLFLNITEVYLNLYELCLYYVFGAVHKCVVSKSAIFWPPSCCLFYQVSSM